MKAYLAIITLLACFVCFYKLDLESIDKKSDEVIHARVVQDMWISMDLLHPTMGQQAYLNKPPLKLWLSLIPIALIGESNFSYRLIDALAGVFTILVTFYLALKLYNSKFAALTAGLMLCANPTLILGKHGARRATQDSLLVLLITVALLLVWMISERIEQKKTANKLIIICGVITSLAVLTKSIAGLLPLIVATPFLVLRHGLKTSTKTLSILTAITLVFPLIYLTLNLLYTPDFFKIAIMRELVERGTHGFHNQADTLYYLHQLFSSFIKPAAIMPGIMLGLSLLYTLFTAFIQREKSATFVLCWGLIPLILYSVPHSRLPWYLAPAFPAFSLMLGQLCDKLLVVSRVCFTRAQFSLNNIGRCAITIIISGVVIYSAASQVNYVLQRILALQDSRITLDRFAAEYLRLKKTSAIGPVVINNEFINTKSDDHHGHFNVEAIYLRMLTANLLEASNEQQLKELIEKSPLPAFVFTQASSLAQNSNYQVLTNLPAFHYRRQALDILSSLSASETATLRQSIRAGSISE